MTIQTLPRKFQIGSLVLNDPSTDMGQPLPVEEVHKLHARQYPQVRHTHLWTEDGELTQHEGEDVMMYRYILAPVSVNG